MADLSRRWFLGGALAVTAAVTIPLMKAMPLRPVLYGDGIHDDTAGLQAIFNGEQVDVVGDHVRLLQADHVELAGGRFNVSRMLTIRRPHLTLRNTTIWCAPGFDGDTVLYIDNKPSSHHIRILENYIDTNGAFNRCPISA